MLHSSTIAAYFSHLVSVLQPLPEVRTVVVAHMVPNTLSFLPAVAGLTSLALVLPKPKSTARPEHAEIDRLFSTVPLSREWAADPESVIQTLQKSGIVDVPLVFVDIGGYFSGSADRIAELYGSNLLGVLEGTENGAKKYEASLPSRVPVVTVARSPLKLPEDYLVGSSVVFSVEAVLREHADILQTRTACVVGYGRVGSAVAEILRGRGINTVVFDTDPIKLAEAAARGFQANVRLHDAISPASLVICATGSKALRLDGFGMLRSGCVVASVTSADDELDLSALDDGYTKTDLLPNLVRYEENRGTGRHFLFVAGGNAANFLHGAVIGPAIQLIEGEKLAAIRAIADGKFKPRDRIQELAPAERRTVAEIWNEHFLN